MPMMSQDLIQTVLQTGTFRLPYISQKPRWNQQQIQLMIHLYPSLVVHQALETLPRRRSLQIHRFGCSHSFVLVSTHKNDFFTSRTTKKMAMLVISLALFAIIGSCYGSATPTIVNLIGNIEHSAFYANCFLAVSKTDAFACLDPTSGLIRWRFLIDSKLGDGRKVIASEKQAFLLQYPIATSDQTFATLYALSVKDGSFLWDLRLLFEADKVSSGIDMSYNREQSLLYVLHANTLHIIQPTIGRPSLASISSASVGISGLNFLQLATSSNSVAVGCVLASNGFCGDGVILKMSAGQQANVEAFKVPSSLSSATNYGKIISSVKTAGVDAKETLMSLAIFITDTKLTVVLESGAEGSSSQKSSVEFSLSTFGTSSSFTAAAVESLLLDQASNDKEKVPLFLLTLSSANTKFAILLAAEMASSGKNRALKSLYQPFSVDDQALVIVDSKSSTLNVVNQITVLTSSTAFGVIDQLNGGVILRGGQSAVLRKLSLAPGATRATTKDSQSSSFVITSPTVQTIIAAKFDGSVDWVRYEALANSKQALLFPADVLQSSSSFVGSMTALCRKVRHTNICMLYNILKHEFRFLIGKCPRHAVTLQLLQRRQTSFGRYP